MSSLLLPTSIVAVALAMLALITASDFVFWAVPRLLRVEAFGGGSSWWATDDGFAGGVFLRTFFCELSLVPHPVPPLTHPRPRRRLRRRM